MKNKNNINRLAFASFILLIITMLIMPEIAEARRGGFGGFRGSRGFSRSTQSMKSTKPSTFKAAPRSRTSFGGTRMSSTQAKAKYGTPRRVQQTVGKNGQGAQQRYNINHYGGYSSGLMTGYMVGHTSLLWLTPFHPAFYYTRPQYVENPDGSIDVYPPTISAIKIIMGIILLMMLIWFIRTLFQKRKSISEEEPPKSSFS